MSEFFCNKVKLRKGWALVPAHGTDEEAMKKLPVDQPVRVKVTRMRNVGHHRKYFALLNYAFDCWEPPELEDDPGRPKLTIEKNFDTFRKHITVLSGFYECHFNIHGELRIEPKSISFANMSQDEFEELYSKTIDVILVTVLRNYTREDLDGVVNDILEFDG